MRQKATRKARYPRLPPGDDQLPIILQELGLGGRGEGQGPTEQGEAGGPTTAPRGPDSSAGKKGGKKKASSKHVHLASLPDRYEPLGESGGERESKEERKYKRKQKAKKYARNVGKALLTGCRYVLIGFQGLATAYSAPWGGSTAVAMAMAR